MTHILVTVTGGIIERVTFFDSKSLALRVLASFVKRMNPEEDDAAVFDREGLVANAKDFLNEAVRYLFVKEVAHRANENGSRLLRFQRCVQFLG